MEEHMASVKQDLDVKPSINIYGSCAAETVIIK